MAYRDPFAEAWATGQTLPLEQIVAHALAGSEERSARLGQDGVHVVTIPGDTRARTSRSEQRT